MTKNILLLGRIEILLDDMQRQLRIPDIQLFDGTGVEDVRSVFAQANIDHVFIISGPQGFVPFVRSVPGGLKDYEI